MKLPNYQVAVVPQTKIVDYLLSLSHRDGRPKAVFFIGFGFSADDWQVLATALLHHAADYEITSEQDSPFGKRYAIEGIMQMPDGRTAMLRSVWFIDTGETVPRFVTAYPLPRQQA